MRILATVRWADAKGGAERSVLDVTGRLAQRGNDVTLIYLEGEELLAEYRRRGITTVRGFDGYLDKRRRGRSLVGLARTSWRGIRQNPELVYVQDYGHVPVGSMVSSVRRAALISHLRLTPPVRWARQYRATLPRVDRFIAVSNDVRERFAESGLRRDRIDVVHNGLDLDEFNPGSEADRRAAREELGIADGTFVVAYSGRLDRQKGVETLLAACKRRTELGRPVQLIAAGQPIWHASEAEGEDYLARLKQLGEPSGARFLGARRDIVPIYRAADVVVVPSIWTEPFGRVVIEAMACARAVIASRVGGIPEILTGDLARYLVEPGDVDDLVRRLDEVEADTAEIGATCRREAEQRFSIETTLDGIEETIRKALR